MVESCKNVSNRGDISLHLFELAWFWGPDCAFHLMVNAELKSAKPLLPTYGEEKSRIGRCPPTELTMGPTHLTGNEPEFEFDHTGSREGAPIQVQLLHHRRAGRCVSVSPGMSSSCDLKAPCPCYHIVRATFLSADGPAAPASSSKKLRRGPLIFPPSAVRGTALQGLLPSLCRCGFFCRAPLTTLTSKID
jgi:hypothetical protein